MTLSHTKAEVAEYLAAAADALEELKSSLKRGGLMQDIEGASLQASVQETGLTAGLI